MKKWPPEDQVTNQQRRSKRLKFLETFGEDVSQISRPSTAPARRVSRPSVRTPGAGRPAGYGRQAEIRAIVKSKERGKPEGMIEGLMARTYKEVDVKRVEYDLSCEDVGRKEREYGALCMEMKDLLKEGEALGVFKFKEAERLEPIKSVSNKPIFSKYAHFDQLESALKVKKEKLEERNRISKVYRAMKARLEDELVSLQHANAKKQKAVSQLASDVSHRRKVELQYLDLRAERVGELKRQEQEFKEETDMWQLEIKTKELFLEQKAKVERFYETSKKVEKKIQPVTQKDPVEATTRKIQASKAVWHLKKEKAVRQRKHIVLEETTNKDQYAAAFAEIGVKLRESNPAAAYRLYMSQQNIQQELDRKVVHYETELDAIRTELEDLREKIKVANVESGETTTYRAIAEEEKELNLKEKELAKERAEISYLQNTIRPVKLGLIELSHKLGHPITTAVSSPAELLLTEMYDRLETAINALPEAHRFRQNVSSKALTSRDTWTPCKSQPLTALSKYNVRVKPLTLTPRDGRPLLRVMSGEKLTEVNPAGSGSMKSVLSSPSTGNLSEVDDMDDEKEDESGITTSSTKELLGADLENAVLSREELKQVSKELAEMAGTSARPCVTNRRERLERKSIRVRSQRMRKILTDRKPLVKAKDGEKAKTSAKSSRSIQTRSVRILN